MEFINRIEMFDVDYLVDLGFQCCALKGGLIIQYPLFSEHGVLFNSKFVTTRSEIYILLSEVLASSNHTVCRNNTV